MMTSTTIEQSFLAADARAERRLKGPEKAAILFLCLGEKRGSELMKKLDDGDIHKITRAVAGLGIVPAPLVEEVMAEFFETVQNGGGVIGSFAIAENMLRTFLPADQAAAILKDIGGPLKERDLWSRLGGKNETVIANYLAGEHDQTAAVILSRLSTDVAAKVLPLLGAARMQAVVERMIQMKAVPTVAMQQIEETLQRDLMSAAVQPGTAEMQQRMADLFNKLEHDAFVTLSAGLEESLPKDFGSIREKMFTFDDLMKLDLQSLARVMRGLQGNILPLALRGASKEVRDQFLEALPARSRDMLLDEMNTMGPVRGRDVRAAQAAITSRARDLAAQEVIRLPRAEDEDEIID